MKANTSLSILWASIVLTLVGSAASSQPSREWRTDEETTGQEYQQEVDAAIEADGSWTAAWIDYRMGYPAVYARSFQADDTPLAPGAPLSDGLGLFAVDLNARKVGEPRLAPLGDGTSLLVWVEGRGGKEHLRAMIISGANPVAGPITVNDIERADSRSQPSVALSGGRALVVWTEGEGSSSKIYGQVLTLDLEPAGENFRIRLEGSKGQTSCRIAPAPGGWVAAWQESPVDLDQVVLLRSISIDGELLDEPILADERLGWDLREPALAATSAGLLVCWTASTTGTVNLQARSFDTSLAPISEPFLIDEEEDAPATPRRPEVAAVEESAAVIVWSAGPASRTRFYARRVDLPDHPAGSIVLVDDPEPPEGQTLVPQGLSVRGNGAGPPRIFWWDARDGWDLVYQMGITLSGEPTGPPTPIETDDGSASQILPSAALSSDGGGLVAWADFRTGGLTVFGVFLAPGARPIAPAFRISESTGGSVSVPAKNFRDLLRNRTDVVTLVDGRSVVAWTTFLAGGESRIFLQNFELGGEPLGGNTTLPTFAEVDAQSSPHIAALPDSTYMVVWRDTSRDSRGNILTHRYLSDGTKVGDTTRVVGFYSENGGQQKPVIASSGTGELVVAWLDDRSQEGNFDVYVQRLGPTGQRIQLNTLISGLEETRIPQSNPAVAAAPDRYVVVWDNNALGWGGAVAGLLVTLPTRKENRVNPDEQVPFSLSTGGSGFKYPQVAMAPDGRFVVTYWDTSSDSVRVMAQRYTAEATVLGPAYSVTSLGGQIASTPGAVSVSSDSILYTWSDSREGKGWDVRTRKVSWEYGGVITAVQTTAGSVSEEDGKLVVRWSVPRSRAGSLYRLWSEAGGTSEPGARPGPRARRIEEGPIGPIGPGGTDYAYHDRLAMRGRPMTYWIEGLEGGFAGPWTGLLPERAAALTLSAYDNPFTESIRLAWSVPVGAELTVAIYDPSGRRLRRSAPVQAADGRGAWLWDGRDRSGRPVPAGVYWARLRAVPGGERTIKILRLR